MVLCLHVADVSIFLFAFPVFSVLFTGFSIVFSGSRSILSHDWDCSRKKSTFSFLSVIPSSHKFLTTF
jgi:hypothetical protein